MDSHNNVNNNILNELFSFSLSLGEKKPAPTRKFSLRLVKR